MYTAIVVAVLELVQDCFVTVRYVVEFREEKVMNLNRAFVEPKR